MFKIFLFLPINFSPGGSLGFSIPASDVFFDCFFPFSGGVLPFPPFFCVGAVVGVEIVVGGGVGSLPVPRTRRFAGDVCAERSDDSQRAVAAGAVVVRLRIGVVGGTSLTESTKS